MVLRVREEHVGKVAGRAEVTVEKRLRVVHFATRHRKAKHVRKVHVHTQGHVCRRALLLHEHMDVQVAGLERELHHRRLDEEACAVRRGAVRQYDQHVRARTVLRSRSLLLGQQFRDDVAVKHRVSKRRRHERVRALASVESWCKVQHFAEVPSMRDADAACEQARARHARGMPLERQPPHEV